MGMCLLTCSCLSFPYSCLGERFIVIWSSVDILILKCLMQILHEFITKLWDGQCIWTFSILCVILNPNLWKSSLSPMWITMIRTRNDYWQLQESNSESRGFFLGLAVEQRPVVVGICTDKMAWHFHQRISSGYLWVPWAFMAPHSSTLAWKIPWTEEPGGLQSIGSRRVRHDWATSRSLFTFMHWRRKWQPTPVFLAEESQGLRSLVGCRLWSRTESDTTDATAAAAAALG